MKIAGANTAWSSSDDREACNQKGVHLVPMRMANAYLIEADDELTLIDAGYSNKEAAVFSAIRGLGRSANQLKHLIFTRGHPDHIGSALRSTLPKSPGDTAIGNGFRPPMKQAT